MSLALTTLFLLALTAVLVLPGLLLAARLGARNIFVLLSCGLGGLAAAGYAVFWLYLASPSVGHGLAVGLVVVAGVSCLALGLPDGTAAWRPLRPLAEPAVLVGLAAVFQLALGFVHGGSNAPTLAAENRYLGGLPIDNRLPVIFADQLRDSVRPLPSMLIGPWQSSDRPPVQTGIYLLEQSVLRADTSELHYQVAGTILQCFWVFGVWALLRLAKVDRRASALVLGAILFANFTAINTLFVWPKLLAAAFAVLAMSVLLTAEWAQARQRGWVGLAVGLDLGWGTLCHPGTLFALFALILVMLALRRIPTWRFLAGAVSGLVVTFAPWLAYGRFYDPPGNYLNWLQLASNTPYDKDASISSMIVKSYQNTSGSTVLHNKLTNLFDTPFGGLITAAKRLLSLFKSYLSPPSVEGTRQRAGLAAAYQLQGWEHLWPVFGLFGLAPLLLIGWWLRRRMTGQGVDDPAARLGALAFVLVGVNIVVAALVFFPPHSTYPAQGTYVIELLGFVGGVLGFWLVSRRLAVIVTVVQSALTIWLHWWAVPTQSDPTLTVHTGLHSPLDGGTSVVMILSALACVSALLWIARGERESADPSLDGSRPDSDGSDIELDVSPFGRDVAGVS